MCDNNTESNNSTSKEARRFGEDIPDDPERQAELVEQSVQEYLQFQRSLEQEAWAYLNRSVAQDYSGIGHGDE